MKRECYLSEKVVAQDRAHDEVDENDEECVANGWALALVTLAVTAFAFGAIAIVMGVAR